LFIVILFEECKKLKKKGKDVKVVISADGKGLDSKICATFHRCSFFLIVDMEKNSLKALENTIKDHPDEIGATVGQIVSNEGIDAVITTVIGPKAFEIFERYGITVYRAEGIIDDAIQQLEKGKLPEITKATVPR
jgi:predicted Fe-Mo cluster-binding NifX family protein